MLKSWTAAVVGLGAIGQGYDYEDNEGESVYTHAQAFAIHPRFKLIAGVDLSADARARFTKKFHVPGFASQEEMYASLSPDVVAVALPTEHHYNSVMRALEFQPQAIICEKPLAYGLDDGLAMVAAARKADCHLLVNYVRRFEPGVNELKARIAAGAYGSIYKGCVWYGKGVANNASHFIDLLSYLLGPAHSASLLERGSSRGTSDADPDFVVSFGEARVHFLSTSAEAFTIAEVDLMGTGGRLRYANSGSSIEVFLVRDNPDFPGYRILGSPVTIENDLKRYQWHVVDSLAKVLDGSLSEFPSSGDSSLITLKTVSDILRSREHGQSSS